jgi:hypothetical protein
VSITICLAADTLGYPEGGGHLWVYLNWALGLKSLGCKVIWLETFSQATSTHRLLDQAISLKSRLGRYGLSDQIALCSHTGQTLDQLAANGYLDIRSAAEADLLLNFRYAMEPEIVNCFRRTALVDIDPGLLQLWISKKQLNMAPHATYFTIGETVGQSAARFPDLGLRWYYTPPCVALDWWSPCQAADDAPFTTVSHWYADEWVEDGQGLYHNDKRSGFLPFLDLPLAASQPLELALCLAVNDDEERTALQNRGWRLKDANKVASTPWDYQHYIQQSRGEFSCVKPSCVRLQNAWISDRTICYLASGKPAVVQHTGSSKFLPDSEGLFRFRNKDAAVCALEAVELDYERHCRAARALAKDFFDAKKVVTHVLERALA